MRAYKFMDARFGMKTLMEKRLKISTLDDLNDPFELLPFEMTSKKKRQALNQARKQWGSMYGMLCFSSDWHDPVVWAHYADKNRGLCLGFEISRERGDRVDYAPKRLPFPVKLEVSHATRWTNIKYTNWSYEKEIRCFTTLETQSEGLYFVEFGEFLRLVKVIVGAKCTLTRDEILKALHPLSHIELIKARPGFHRFEIVKDKHGL